MTFLIADSFTDSLGRLTGDEQKAVKTTAFDLQMDSSAPGLSFHRLDKAKDKRFWSVRVNADIRLIVHQSIREIVVPAYVHAEPKPKPATRPLAAISDDQLLGYGVPAEWLSDVRQADEDGLLALAQHLPAEAAEAILELATGGTPRLPQVAPVVDPFEHPDAQRRFRVVTSVEELERALDAPWDKWAVFLHPEQRQLITREYAGPARVAGSAGTGKTVVALHRAVHLARANPDGRILLATFSEPLAHALRANVKRLIGNEPRVAERLEVHAMSTLGIRLHQAQLGPVRLASKQDIDALLRESSQAASEDEQTKRSTPAYDAAVVDEAQDIGIAQLRFLAALAGGQPNGLFFSGDLGQRIFQQPFSWKALGVDVRGRSKTLHVNCRTSHQIREQADRLLGPEITDVDGNREERRHTVSAFNGPAPQIRTFATEAEESEAVSTWLQTFAKMACSRLRSVSSCGRRMRSRERPPR